MEETRRGWLTKQGRVVKNWKRRYFVLKDGQLAYYQTENDVSPKGFMELLGAAVIYVEPPKVDRSFCLEVSTPSRSLFVAADTKEDMQQWALAIQRAAVVAGGGTVILSSHRIKATAENDDEKPASPRPAAAASAGAAVAATVSSATAAAVPSSGAGAGAGAASAEDGRKKKKKKDKKKKKKRHDSETESETESESDSSEEEEEGDKPAPKKTTTTDPTRIRTESDAFEHEEKERAAKRKPVVFTDEEKKFNATLISEAFTVNEQAWQQHRKDKAKLKKERAKDKWNPTDLKLRKTLKGHESYVNCVTQSHDKIASGGDDASVRVWDASTLKKIAVFEGHEGVVRSVLVTDKFVISGSDDGTIKLWDCDKEKCVKTFKASSGLGTDALVASHDERMLISASEKSLQIWDLKEKKCVFDLLVDKHKEKLTSLALAGQFLFIGSADHTISVWDVCLLPSKGAGAMLTTLEGHRNWVFALCLNADKEILYSAADCIKAWDISGVRKGKVKQDCSVDKAHDAPTVQALTISDDESFLLSASIDGFIRVWELELKSRSKPLASLENKTKFLFSIASYNKRLFTADRDGGIKVWE